MTNLADCFAQDPSREAFSRNYLHYLSNILADLDIDKIGLIIDTFLKAAAQGRALYFIGNGGSAATASHFASDLSMNTRAPGVKPIRAISLVDSMAIITALANDEGYENTLVRQLEIHLLPGDVVVALSVSGNSPNVVEAVKYARQQGALTIGLTGFDGGELRRLADISFHVPTAHGEYGPVEDVFQILDHLIYSYLRLARLGRLRH